MHFPVVFSLKVVAAVDVDLESIIKPVMQKNDVDAEHLRLSKRSSSNGKYNSYTVTFMAKSQEQLDNIYRELSGNPEIVFVL
jgi:putative lipoic acid-binding regulatory protein